jgi:transposase
MEVPFMLACSPRVVDAVWQAVQGHLPDRVSPAHPLGCHRRRIPDRDCFWGILVRLVTGCSWDVAGRLVRIGETTLRRRRDEWVHAGVFDALAAEAIEGYDRIVGLELQDAVMDTSLQKAPFGGEGTGPSFTDRAKRGWKWSVLTDQHGIPLGWVAAGANHPDGHLVAATLDDANRRALLTHTRRVHFDRGYHSESVRAELARHGIQPIIQALRGVRLERRKRMRQFTYPKRRSLGMRWTVERTNSWLTNFGQLRRNTDR